MYLLRNLKVVLSVSLYVHIDSHIVFFLNKQKQTQLIRAFTLCLHQYITYPALHVISLSSEHKCTQIMFHISSVSTRRSRSFSVAALLLLRRQVWPWTYFVLYIDNAIFFAMYPEVNFHANSRMSRDETYRPYWKRFADCPTNYFDYLTFLRSVHVNRLFVLLIVCFVG